MGSKPIKNNNKQLPPKALSYSMYIKVIANFLEFILGVIVRDFHSLPSLRTTLVEIGNLFSKNSPCFRVEAYGTHQIRLKRPRKQNEIYDQSSLIIFLLKKIWTSHRLGSPTINAQNKHIDQKDLNLYEMSSLRAVMDAIAGMVSEKVFLLRPKRLCQNDWHRLLGSSFLSLPCVF